MIQAVVTKGKGVDLDRARRIAERFETQVTTTIPEDTSAMYFLMDKGGLSFVAGGQELRGDFTRLLSRVTGGHLQHEILLKAAKSSGMEEGMRAVDCTAGMGEDSFILAAGGYSVELFEHNPITATLLSDALIRAKNHGQLKEIARRMTLKEGDSKELLSQLSYVPDVIYLDPMFPEKKKSAETKKKLQILHQIENPCGDEEELIQKALLVGAKKIIIKRPPDGPYLAGITPSYSVTRKAVRFDCLIP
ncbi:MAG: class I SAM-dependent methyltransferase [Lachnospiraceae bacterium]|nr:class I SAM-dependent methyltransferase [Lachnospiraceae bacterium]